jgi:hypothetical protein
VKVSAVNVDRGLLLRHGFDDGGIGMTDARDVVVHVDIAPTVPVVQVHAFAPNDLEGLVVKQFRAGSQGQVPTPL